MQLKNGQPFQNRTFDHSKTEQNGRHFFFLPFKNRTLKCSVFEWIRYSNVQNSSPRCISVFEIGVNRSCFCLCNFSLRKMLVFRHASNEWETSSTRWEWGEVSTEFCWYNTLMCNNYDVQHLCTINPLYVQQF